MIKKFKPEDYRGISELLYRINLLQPIHTDNLKNEFKSKEGLEVRIRRKLQDYLDHLKMEKFITSRNRRYFLTQDGIKLIQYIGMTRNRDRNRIFGLHNKFKAVRGSGSG